MYLGLNAVKVETRDERERNVEKKKRFVFKVNLLIEVLVFLFYFTRFGLFLNNNISGKGHI